MNGVQTEERISGPSPCDTVKAVFIYLFIYFLSEIIVISLAMCIDMFVVLLSTESVLQNIDDFNCICCSMWSLKPSLACFLRIHHRIYRILLSQSTQLIHQQRAAEHWR